MTIWEAADRIQEREDIRFVEIGRAYEGFGWFNTTSFGFTIPLHHCNECNRILHLTAEIECGYCDDCCKTLA